MNTKEYYQTFQGRLSKMYTKMQERSNQKGVGLLSRETFMDFANESSAYAHLFETWQAIGFPMQFVPTVDRIDYREGYVIGNIQFLTHSENVLKGNKETNRRPPTGQNTKAVLLNMGDVEKRFPSGKEACDFLGLQRSAICKAIKHGQQVKGWDIQYA